jgi:hypothetical protein
VTREVAALAIRTRRLSLVTLLLAIAARMASGLSTVGKKTFSFSPVRVVLVLRLAVDLVLLDFFVGDSRGRRFLSRPRIHVTFVELLR